MAEMICRQVGEILGMTRQNVLNLINKGELDAKTISVCGKTAVHIIDEEAVYKYIIARFPKMIDFIHRYEEAHPNEDDGRSDED